MENKKKFSLDILKLDDAQSACENIVLHLKRDVHEKLKRKGAVVGISGGIDSSVTLALCARAFGPENVLGLIMPEQDSSESSAILAKKLADNLNVKSITEDITGALAGLGCYERRDEAVRKVFPEYGAATHKMKIGVKSSGLFTNLPPLFALTIIDKQGNEKSARVPGPELRQIEAASNFKQRCRMSMLYYYAECLHYAVVGTPNKHEVEQGFFVKYGDGGADVMPIGSLYKSQVYQLGSYLDIPGEIMERTPTTDTYTAEQSQEEFFYQLPYFETDLLWYAFENKYEPGEVAAVMHLSSDQVKSVFVNFERKMNSTAYLRMHPIRETLPFHERV